MSFVAVLGFMAIIATCWGVWRFRAWAEQRQIVDMPNERSSHTRPTPRGGGLIIVGVTLFFGAILAATLVPDSIWHVYLPFAAGAILIAAISWLDDLRSLSNSARLAAHLSGAVFAIAGLGYWRTLALPFFGTITLGWWGALITALWIVGLTNAYNFMDGTDWNRRRAGSHRWAGMGISGLAGGPTAGFRAWILGCLQQHGIPAPQLAACAYLHGGRWQRFLGIHLGGFAGDVRFL
jgi:hypothetical protein